MTSTVLPHVPWAVRGLFATALVFAMREARVLLAPVVIAVVLTFVLAPAVRYMRRRGISEALGAGLLVLLLLGSVVPLAAGLAEPAAQWWDKAPTTPWSALPTFRRCWRRPVCTR
jgi:predicted PurR-regulated permease PerM